MRLVYRHLPVVSQDSVTAAIAAECAADQDRFWEYHDALFSQVGVPFSTVNLKRVAGDIGLAQDAFNACLDDRSTIARVAKDVDDARALGVNSTPSFVINGVLVRGLQSLATFEEIIEAELAKQG